MTQNYLQDENEIVGIIVQVLFVQFKLFLHKFINDMYSICSTLPVGVVKCTFKRKNQETNASVDVLEEISSLFETFFAIYPKILSHGLVKYFEDSKKAFVTYFMKIHLLNTSRIGNSFLVTWSYIFFATRCT